MICATEMRLGSLVHKYQVSQTSSRILILMGDKQTHRQDTGSIRLVFQNKENSLFPGCSASVLATSTELSLFYLITGNVVFPMHSQYQCYQSYLK
jgi:hypothetical protein